ncbi:MurR/RpiR family transcriptional regulator [Arthrobacter crusticola]|uniref:MurR/RpiR family transcriptional regulator n=1 Tax=Arthrobacter crusticola TaxID=2547960 RepID=A0A4R5TZH1_9MICC|nr:MurR/RpiR family transcriptional regulator [Arthrobacter crusticola]TDK26650.1 MurR/RpiR family transcriptional regulator [Arthrobacter crusticola]
MSIQSAIQAQLPTLPPSARRVAEEILADPETVLRHTISELAHICSTSEPSVVRFCRAVGYAGYAQLRLSMATEIGRETAQFGDTKRFGADISPDDSLADTVAKIAFAETLGIEETLSHLDIDQLRSAVESISTARQILVYGVGAGAVVADDLQHKLFRIRRMVHSFDDPHDALMGASLMAAGDVAVAFSHSGRTAETLEFVERAREAGATTIGITNGAGSPLAEATDLCLLTMVRETAFRSGAMASRIAQLAVVDCIFVGVAQSSYDATVEALETTRAAITNRKQR